MKMKQVTVCFDRRKKVKIQGKGLVEIKIYINRDQKKYIKVAEIAEQDWPAYSASAELQKLVEHYEGVLAAMRMVNKAMTLANLNESLGLEPVEKKDVRPSHEKTRSFIDFFHDELDAEKIEPATRKAREVVYRSILDFGKFKKFEDLTPRNILEYHKWLQHQVDRRATSMVTSIVTHTSLSLFLLDRPRNAALFQRMKSISCAAFSFAARKRKPVTCSSSPASLVLPTVMLRLSTLER